MPKLKISGKELRKIGYPEGPIISLAMNIMEKNFKHLSKEDAFEILSSVLQSPNQYAHDGVLGKIAEALIPKPKTEKDEVPLNDSGIHFNIFGGEGIEQGALQQMYTAAKLPIAVAGDFPLAVYWQQKTQLFPMELGLTLAAGCAYLFTTLIQKS
jgi:tRNA-splicing ligase RtcB